MKQLRFLSIQGLPYCLLSAKLYDSLPHEQRPQMDPVSSKVLTAASTEFPLKGKGSFKVEIDDISTDCLLYRCRVKGVIDVTKECLTLRGMKIPLVFQGPVGY